MRIIKFRAKVKSSNHWIIGDLVRDMSFHPDRDAEDCVICQDNDYAIVDENTVGQYTGLKDKNGKEIYEGDILEYKSGHPKHNGKIFNNVVEFASGQSLCGWRMRNKSCVVKATPYKFGSSTIIGNIYETPSLLTQ